jgi:hypothetical protein
MALFDDPPLHDFPDRAIRKALEHPHNLRDLLAEAVPHLAERFHCEQAQLLDRAFLLEDWRGRESDLLFRIPFRATDAEQPVLVCLLLEHQSAPDPRMPLRMLLYAVLYWEREWKQWEEGHASGEPLRLTPILPIVFHTGPRPWGSNRLLAELMEVPVPLRSHVPHWDVVFWDLAGRTPRELLDAVGEFSKVLAVVRAEREDSATYLAVFEEALQRLELLSGQDKMRWRELVWLIVSWGWHRRPRQEWQPLLAAALASQTHVAHQQEVKAMSETLLKSYAEEVFEEGQLHAYRQMLRRLLERRFGPLPVDLARRIETASDLKRLQACIDEVYQIPGLSAMDL